MRSIEEKTGVVAPKPRKPLSQRGLSERRIEQLQPWARLVRRLLRWAMLGYVFGGTADGDERRRER